MAFWDNQKLSDLLRNFLGSLQKNNLIQNGELISKDVAKHHLKEFIKSLDFKVNFWVLTSAMNANGLLAKPKNHDILRFKPERLQQFLVETNIERKREKKTTYVSQPVAFRKPKSEDDEKLFNKVKCNICGTFFGSDQVYESHLKSDEHIFRETFYKAAHNWKKSKDLTFRIVEQNNITNILVKYDFLHKYNLELVNQSSTKSYQLIQVLFDKNLTGLQLSKKGYPIEVSPDEIINFNLEARFLQYEDVYYPLLFVLKESSSGTMCYLPIEIVFRLYSEDVQELAQYEPYKRQSKPAYEDVCEEEIRGNLPKKPSFSFKTHLPWFELPKDIVFLLNAGLKPSKALTSLQETKLREIKALLDVKDKSNCLTVKNYDRFLQLLLFLEEHQMCKDIHDYDMENKTLDKIKHSDLFQLQVPGLAEKRPSLVIRDSVFLKESKDGKVKYVGYVHSTELDKVQLSFHNRFNEIYIQGKKFYVSFDFNRFSLHTEHQAVMLTRKTKIGSLMFPTNVPTVNVIKKLTWKNRLIESNKEQQQAILHILSKTSYPSPYLVFGPPGTGKTMTIVEAITQIYFTQTDFVLICTPSNDAANEVTKRLLKCNIPTRQIFRYVAQSCYLNTMPSELHKCVNYNSDHEFYHPSIEDLCSRRLVVTTLVNASRLINGGVSPKHFQYVFIDEAGQATETETLIPIAGMISSAEDTGKLYGQVVLTGDPKQLGPIIHSKLAKEYGYDISMLERLMRTTVYKKDNTDKYNPCAVTKLLKNYRSHPAILDFPNKKFYDSELEPAADATWTHVAVNWEHLPNKNFPVIFHSVVSEEEREGNSPSFFNLREVQVVMDYLSKLIGSRLSGVLINEDHIGIISPYKKQVQKLTQACRKKKYDKLFIGSVEQIQGQERLIIIISTVRSKSDFIKYDMQFHLGFLNNEKRLNVALTRAKALLIVIGNPNILQHDPYWRDFIKYVMDNKGFTGKPFNFAGETERIDLQSIADRLSALNLSLDHEKYGDKADFSRGNN